MTRQELEDRQYEAGRFKNEFQAAYAVASLTTNYSPDQALIDKHLKRGRFVVVSEVAAYCRYTDAILNRNRRFFNSSHATEEDAWLHVMRLYEALDYFDDFQGYFVVTP